MGGKDGAGLPLSLKVKNTFIDINGGFQEDDATAHEEDFLRQDAPQRRQFSEPVPFTRAMTGTSDRAATRHVEPLEEEEEVGSEDLNDEIQEPEQEIDPSWRMKNRQESEKNWAAASRWGRMETEQSWPTWGLPAGMPPIVPPPNVLGGDPNAYGNGMWLYQTPGMPGMPGGGTHPWPMNGVMMQPDMMPGAQSATSGAAAVAQPAAGDMPASWATTTTVMMRNLPNKYTQHMLLEELNQAGFLGTFDFVYLPIDPDTSANRGYAFMNFTDPAWAWMLKMTYEGRKMNSFNSDKVVSVAPAALQGFEANYAHYSTSRVNRGDPAARPLFLREPNMKGQVKTSGSRRRGGRRSSGSLIDLATREQNTHTIPAAGPPPPQSQPQPQVLPQPQALPAQQAPEPVRASVAPAGSAAKPTEAEANKSGPGGAPSQSGPRFCPFCGGKCQTHFRFCQFCGTSLNLAGASS